MSQATLTSICTVVLQCGLIMLDFKFAHSFSFSSAATSQCSSVTFDWCQHKANSDIFSWLVSFIFFIFSIMTCISVSPVVPPADQIRIISDSSLSSNWVLLFYYVFSIKVIHQQCFISRKLNSSNIYFRFVRWVCSSYKCLAKLICWSHSIRSCCH